VKQLGNLAIVCALRSNVLLQILDGKATVFVGESSARKQIAVDWSDDAKIEQIIHELNFGSMADKKEAAQ
jgi:hypothetical protein